MNTVYLARHGETEWSRVGRMQGRLDSPLTTDGMAEIKQVVEMIATLPIDAIFSSPLGRAATTAAVYGAALGLPVVLRDDLQEVDFGEMSGMTREEIEASFPGALAERSANKYSWRFPAGESYEDADVRAGSALQEILAVSHSPLVISHEMIGRMLLRNLLGLNPDEVLELRQPHRVVYAVDTTAMRMVEMTPDKSV